MVCGGQQDVVLEDLSQFLSEFGGKLRSMIGYDFGVEAEMEEYFVEK